MKLVVLGPKGTYSDIAARKFILENNLKCDIIYEPSILFVSMALENASIAILPFENTLDGFVLETLDNIISHNFTITNQLVLDIDFAFVSNAKKIEDVKNIYCQFKVYGQCVDFISKHRLLATKTESNTETLAKIDESNDLRYGAIIPMHLLDEKKYNIVIKHIADSKNNQTRFFIVQKDKEPLYKPNSIASLVITIEEDRIGALYEILSVFHILEINLNAILSRPARTKMGVYKFYIECSFNDDEYVLEKLEKQMKDKGFLVNVLGIYNRL